MYGKDKLLHALSPLKPSIYYVHTPLAEDKTIITIPDPRTECIGYKLSDIQIPVLLSSHF